MVAPLHFRLLGVPTNRVDNSQSIRNKYLCVLIKYSPPCKRLHGLKGMMKALQCRAQNLFLLHCYNKEKNSLHKISPSTRLNSLELSAMLRLQICGHWIPGGVAKTHGKKNLWVLQFRSLPQRSPQIRVKALRDERGGASRFPGQNWDPGLEIEVPFEQRPVNEYSSLKNGLLYSWGELSPGPLFARLGSLWLVAFTVLGAPIAAASFNPSRDPLRFMLAAGTGTLFLVSLVVLRIYLGWSYVGDRLLSAVIPYEESGWYDGQMWVKPPEVLARDRLLGSYKVKPVIKLLKQTLVGTGVLLVTAVSLFIFATPVEDFLHTVFITNNSNMETAKIKGNMRKEELLRLPVEVMDDDDLAAAAAEAADGRPVYCRDRFYRALAGGQYCKWDDLVN